MKDSLDTKLDREKIQQHLESKKDSYYQMVYYLLNCWNQVYPGEQIDTNIIQSWIWEIVRVDPEIVDFFTTYHELYYEEWSRLRFEITQAPKRITKRIIEILKKEHPGEFNYL